MAASKKNPLVLAATQVQAASDRFHNLNAKMGHPLVWEREARFAMQQFERLPRLLECDPGTIRDSIVNLAAMGLSLNPQTQEAALIPRWNSKKGMLDCTASPSHSGGSSTWPARSTYHCGS